MSDLMTRAVLMMPLDLAMSDEFSRRQFHSRAQEALLERDELIAMCGELLISITSMQNFARFGAVLPANEGVELLIKKAEKLLEKYYE